MDDEVDCEVDNLLEDPVKKEAILERLARLDAPTFPQSGSNRGGGSLLPPSGPANITLPQGAFFNPAALYNFSLFPVVPPQPFAWPFPVPPQGWPNSSGNPVPETNATTTCDVNDTKDGEVSDYGSAGSDVIRLLTDEEANQFRKSAVFDLTVRNEASRDNATISGTNFDWNLSEEERKRILSDFQYLSAVFFKHLH